MGKTVEFVLPVSVRLGQESVILNIDGGTRYLFRFDNKTLSANIGDLMLEWIRGNTGKIEVQSPEPRKRDLELESAMEALPPPASIREGYIRRLALSRDAKGFWVTATAEELQEAEQLIDTIRYREEVSPKE